MAGARSRICSSNPLRITISRPSNIKTRLRRFITLRVIRLSPRYSLGEDSLSSILSKSLVPLTDRRDSSTNHFLVDDSPLGITPARWKKALISRIDLGVKDERSLVSSSLLDPHITSAIVSSVLSSIFFILYLFHFLLCRDKDNGLLSCGIARWVLPKLGLHNKRAVIAYLNSRAFLCPTRRAASPGSSRPGKEVSFSLCG